MRIPHTDLKCFNNQSTSAASASTARGQPPSPRPLPPVPRRLWDPTPGPPPPGKPLTQAASSLTAATTFSKKLLLLPRKSSFRVETASFNRENVRVKQQIQPEGARRASGE